MGAYPRPRLMTVDVDIVSLPLLHNPALFLDISLSPGVSALFNRLPRRQLRILFP